MATCKDCLHYEACVNEVNRRIAHKEGAEKCRTFKDKSQFIKPVFCKDCFFFEKGKDSKTYCSNSQGISGDVAELDFCSYGEQKESLIPNDR